MLGSIDIKDFRGFDDLRLDGLGRVNLIVGKNNTGKTSLLEAIALLANPEVIKSLPGLFRANVGPVNERFYRWLPRDGADTALLGAAAAGGRRQVWITRGKEPESPDLRRPFPGLPLWCDGAQKSLRVHAVSVQHRGPDSMVDAFAEAVRSPTDERQMEALLAAVDDRIRTVRLDAVQSRPFIAVDVGLSERVPLAQAGQGVYRLVAIFSELLGNKPNVCFIDEIENGIHHTALAKVWTGIAEVSERLGIQVFATTHSRECLVAAHETFAARRDDALRVLQLYSLSGGVRGRVLGRENIEAAIVSDIEVR